MKEVEKRLEDAFFGAFEKEVKQIAAEIIDKHKAEMQTELEQKTVEIVAKLGMRLSKHMSVQTLQDRMIIEVFDKTNRD